MLLQQKVYVMPHFNIRMLLAPVLLACSFILTHLPASADDTADNWIYKWTDDAGQTHYSQLPPPNQEAEKVRKATKPRIDPGSNNQLQERLEAMEKRQQERREAKDEAERQANVRKIVKANCDNARKNLALLQRGANNAYRTPDGEVKRLTAEDRQARIDEANRQIEEYCNPDFFKRKAGN